MQQPTSLSVTPSHLNVAGWRSRRRRPSMPWNFRFPPFWAPPQPSSRFLLGLGWEVSPDTRPTSKPGRGHPPTPRWAARPTRVLQTSMPPVWMGSLGFRGPTPPLPRWAHWASPSVPPGRGGQLGRQCYGALNNGSPATRAPGSRQGEGLKGVRPSVTVSRVPCSGGARDRGSGATAELFGGE